MTLNEYIDIEQDCRRHQIDSEGYLNNLEKAKEELETLRNEFVQKINSISSNKEVYLNERISIEVGNAILRPTNELQSLKIELDIIKKSKVQANKGAIEGFYSDYLNLAKQIKMKIKRQQKKNIDITKLIPRTKINIKSSKGMDKIYDILEKYDKIISNPTSVDGFTGIVNKTIGNIFKGSSFAKYFDSMGRLIYTVAYYLLFFALILIFPEIFFAFIFVITFIYFHKNLPVRKQQVETFKIMEYHLSLCNELIESIEERVNGKEKEEIERITKVNNAKITELTNEIEKYELSIAELKRNVKDKIVASSTTQEYEQEQRKIVEEEYNTRIDEALDDVSCLQSDYDANLKELNELITQRDTGKIELEDRYFKLGESGTSKILPRKFLLGFSEYIPLTLDMPNYMINLPANMRSPDIIIKFVYMCIMQILCTTNPSCVDITIVDLINGTSNYGMFGTLKEIVHIVKDKSELMKTLDDFYMEKTIRDTSIKSKFDNIDEYNEYMISQYGITQTYKILIITHNIDELMGNNVFRQLQASGDIGIVTMTIWDKNMYTFDPKKKKDYYVNLIKYLPTMQNVSYLGDGGDLTSLDSKYVIPKLQYITEQVRRMR